MLRRCETPLSCSDAPAGLAALRPVRVEVEPRHEVEEVLPGALGTALAERGQLLAEDVVLGQSLDELDQALLALARHPGRDVHQAVRVRADEVHRRAGQPVRGQLVVHGRPPAARHPRVADLRAAQHAHAQVHPLLGDQPQALVEALAPSRAQARPVVRRAAQRLGALLGRRLVLRRPAGRALANAQLVPLDLERYQRGNEVVHVGRARQQHGVHPVTAVVPAPPARRGVRLVPLVDDDAVAREDLGLLAHDHELGAGDPVREPPDRVDERAQVGLVAVRQRVQARADRPVRGLEHPERRLAARAQQRVVGALVELHLVREPALGPGLGGAGQCEARDDHRYSFT